MYLKNTSEAAVVINTVVGKVGIKPHEFVDIKYKILPPMSNLLVEISEEEFNSFRNKETKTKNVSKPKNVSTKSEDTPVESKPTEPEVKDDIQIEQPGVMSFVNALLNPGQDEKDIAQQEALKVTEADTNSQKTQLEQQIEDLKVVWNTTTNPRKKEKITKQIKDLQKQVKQLQK